MENGLFVRQKRWFWVVAWPEAAVRVGGFIPTQRGSSPLRTPHSATNILLAIPSYHRSYHASIKFQTFFYCCNRSMNYL